MIYHIAPDGSKKSFCGRKLNWARNGKGPRGLSLSNFLAYRAAGPGRVPCYSCLKTVEVRT